MKEKEKKNLIVKRFWFIWAVIFIVGGDQSRAEVNFSNFSFYFKHNNCTKKTKISKISEGEAESF